MKNETDRLQHLSDFALEYDSYHEDLRPFVELAKKITDSPFCEVNIIDAYNQWTIARSEKELKVIPREESICVDTIKRDEPHEISDLQKDERYKDRYYVTGDPHFRYYYGVQVTSDGKNIASFCVLDNKAKKISDEQKQLLGQLADWIALYLEKERRIFQKHQVIHELKDQFKKLNHDIRSPINGIVGIVDLYLSDQKTVEVPVEDLSMIKDCAQAIVDKIDDRLKTEDDNEGVEKIRLRKVFDKVMSLYRPRAKKKEIRLSVESKTDNNIELSEYSCSKLIQIVSNLVANAIKFTHKKGNIDIEYSSTSDDQDERLDIWVKDDGVGMSENQLLAFEKGDSVLGALGTEGELSFGIGLQHIRQLITELSGAVSAKSNKGQGSVFHCSIPVGHL